MIIKKGKINKEIQHDKETIEDREAKDWSLTNNIPIILDNYETLSDLENAKDKFMSVPIDLQTISDDKSLSLYGSTNIVRYRKQRNEFYRKDSKEAIHHRGYDDGTKYAFIDPVNMIMMMRECAHHYSTNWMDEYIKASKVFNESFVLSKMNKFRNTNKKYIEKIVFEDNKPMPDGLILPPLSYEESTISHKPFTLIDNTGITKWRDMYKSIICGSNIDEYMKMENVWKESIQTIYNSEDEDKNEKLISLGWNPYIEPLEKNIWSASDVSKYRIYKDILRKIYYFDLSKLELPTIANNDIFTYKLFIFAPVTEENIQYEYIISNDYTFNKNMYRITLTDNSISVNSIDHKSIMNKLGNMYIMDTIYADSIISGLKRFCKNNDSKYTESAFSTDISIDTYTIKLALYKIIQNVLDIEADNIGDLYKVSSNTTLNLLLSQGFKDYVNRLNYIHTIVDKTRACFASMESGSLFYNEDPTYGEIKQALKNISII